jgi:ATP synthase protein I
MFAGLVGGGAIGWGLDWLFGHFGIHTKPWLMIVFVVLGAAAGIRNVMNAAKEINEQMAAQGSVPAVKSDEDN